MNTKKRSARAHHLPQQHHQPPPPPPAASDPISVPHKRFRDQQEYADVGSHTKSFYTFQNVVPPEAGTQFHCVDQGTASAKFMRPSMYNVPESETLRKASKLPLAVTIRPFAPVLPEEDPVPEVDMRAVGAGSDDPGPIRCRRCRTYMNPAMHHSGPVQFTCNICHFPNNQAPGDYAAMINPSTGARVDATVRPELHRGVYDVLVPDSYRTHATTSRLHHVFLIDITVESIKAQLPAVAADAIRSILNLTRENSEPRSFAIMLFGKNIHFYNLGLQLDLAPRVISSDLDDPFIPFHHGLFADPEQSELALEDALAHLELLAEHDPLLADTEPCFSLALRTAMMALDSVGGGKISTILTALPSWGPGALKFKDTRTQARSLSPEVQKQIYTPDSEYYQLLARDCMAASVGIDCFAVCQTPVDMSNLAWLCTTSGGHAYKWTNFHLDRDARNVVARFVASVRNTKGSQGQLKLRCSNGLQVAQYYRAGVDDTTAAAEPILPVVSSDQAFTVLLEYDGKLNTKFDCHFQAAVLYTDAYGARKVRVINLVLAVTERLDDVFNFLDQDCVAATIIRDALLFLGKQTLAELRDSINEKLVDVFTQYRAKSELGSGHPGSTSNQLLFPDSLVHLPVFLLAFLKSPCVRESNYLLVDTRLEDAYQLLTIPIERLMYRLYPGLVEVHSLTEADGVVSEGDEFFGFISLPKYVQLSLSLLQDGVYVMGDGYRVMVWIRPNANPMLLQDLFGQDVDSIDKVDSMMDQMPELDTEISIKVRTIIRFFNEEISGLECEDYGIQIVREGIDGSDMIFKDKLIEDGSRNAISINTASYSDYLSKLHRAIKVKLENDSSYSEVKLSIDLANDTDTLAQRLLQM